MATKSLPLEIVPNLKYVDYAGEINYPWPWGLERAHYSSFLFLSKKKHLQKICDTWYNDPTNGELQFEPFLPLVYVTFASYTDVCSLPPKFREMGTFNYKEVIFCFFVRRKMGCFAPLEILEPIRVHVPYVFVDQPAPIACGRRVLGMPKVWGKIDFEVPHSNSGKPNPGKFDLYTQAYKEFGPESKMDIFHVANITQADGGKLPLEWEDHEQAHSEMKELLRDVFDKLGGEERDEMGELSTELMDKIIGHYKLRFVTLKQFRDSATKRDAMYKIVLEFYASKIRIDKMRWLHDEFTLTFPEETASFPMAKDFGIDGKKALAAFDIDWGFQFQPGGILWNASDKKTPLERALDFGK
jgi:hypothetical protein